MKKFIVAATLAVLTLGQAAFAEVKIQTHSSTAPKATVTVVHFGANWCGPCKKMEPDMHAFEQKFKSKVNIVGIDVDDKKSPEMAKHGKLMELTEGIPFTVWLDSKGNVVDQAVGILTEKQLAERTEKAAKAK